MTLDDFGASSAYRHSRRLGEECGGNYRCWDVDYGFGRAISHYGQFSAVMFHIRGTFGFLLGEPQLNVENFDWLRSY